MKREQKKQSSSVERFLAAGLGLFYFLSLIPIIIVGFFNFPSADDINMGIYAHDVFAKTGNIAATLWKGIELAWHDYLNWMGYYTSTALMSVPPSVFGEQFYAASTFILILILSAAVAFFMHTLLGRFLGMDGARVSIISSLTLMLMVQSLPAGMARVEAFFWYCSGANYIMTFSLGALWLSLVIRLAVTEKHRVGLTVWSCVTGFLLGGGNMMTSLCCTTAGVLLLIWLAIPAGIKNSIAADPDPGQGQAGHSGVKSQSFKRLLAPVLFLLAGFLACCLAPGNSVRESITEGFGPVKSIAVALLYTATFCINSWTRFEHILVLLFAAPFFWSDAPRIKRLSFRYPLLVTVLAYGLISANAVPPLYALGQIDAGRLQALLYMQYVLLIVLTEGYLIGWLRLRVLGLTQEPAENSAGKGRTRTIYLAALAAAFIAISALAAAADNDYYTVTEAVRELADGLASGYAGENAARLKILKDPSVTDAVLEPYRNRPALLLYDEPGADPENWINDGMARYYGKNSVRVGR